MTCAIMQPTYLHWIGYFDLIDQVNKFVFLDSVQLTKRSWQVRNRILTKQGELYLTVPLQKTSSRDETIISSTLISDTENWKNKHLQSIEHAYSKSPYFNEVFPFVWELYNQPYKTIAEFNITAIEKIAFKIGIRTQFYRSSRMSNLANEKKDELLSKICFNINCTDYLSPRGSAAYIELKSPGGAFVTNNIQLYYQHFSHPTYRQLGREFVPFMCILDILFNEGFNNALSIIKKGRMHPYYYQQYAKLIA